ncbi:hypothetical protein GLOIN_2v1778046 [Rhizophagus clarus]|uniref:Uncharacterized protein n=1 Tax=Rhizophagus clarus TaxID=94130 RepID=A0A8H3QM51_9GLOM|nr:hypothetical protein GLOIN_2v1778046 [Rhizophagus clarus]
MTGQANFVSLNGCTAAQIGADELNKAAARQPRNAIAKLRALCRIARHKGDRISDPLVSYQASRRIHEPLSVSASQQQGIFLEDMQKAIQSALVQQKTESSKLKVTLEDEKGKPINITGNYADNQGRDSKGLGHSQNQFHMKVHDKTYIIPTYNKTLEVKDPIKEARNMFFLSHPS